MTKRRFGAKETTIIKDLVKVMKDMKANNLKIDQGDLLNEKDVNVSIQFDRKGKRYIFRCSNYPNKTDNLRAAQLSITYLYRALESYGVLNTKTDLFDKMFNNFFIGFEATPDDSVLLLGNNNSWYDILNLDINATKEEIISAYKSLSKVHHPDYGGRSEDFIKLRKAYEEGIKKF